MLSNHDFYRPHTDIIYSSNCMNFDVREDKPITFTLVDGNYVISSENVSTDANE